MDDNPRKITLEQLVYIMMALQLIVLVSLAIVKGW
jgi:hypothetical protein